MMSTYAHTDNVKGPHVMQKKVCDYFNGQKGATLRLH